VRLLKLLAKSKAFEILSSLNEGEKNFSQLGRIVGDRPTTMRRLRELCEAGLVQKREVGDRLGTVMYSLSEKGRRAYRLLAELERLPKCMKLRSDSS
jgi:DNA-binding HxlR family transcriptional regulator